MTAVILPLQRLARRGDRQRGVQQTLHRSARGFLRFADRLGFIRAPSPEVMGEVTAEVAGLAEPGPRLLVANHPSMLDAIVGVALLPQVDCVINASWRRHPFVGGLARAAGHVPNEPGPAAVDECARRLAAGRTLLIFPEGTRSPESGLGPFRRGAAHIALRSGAALTPVVFRYDPPAFTRGQSWYDAPAERFRVTVQVLDEISPEGARHSGVSTPVAARRLTAELRERFEKALENNQTP